MLKSRKIITKKEIKYDPFLDSIYQAKEYFETNKQLITRIGVIIVAVVVIVFIINNNSKVENEASEAALGKAFVNLSIGDRDNGLLQLELLVDDYSGTEAAQRGLFMLARLYYEQKDYLTAESNLQDFLDDPIEEFHAGALMMKADIEKINGYTESISELIKQAIKYALNESEKDKYSLVLAEYYINIGNYNDALELAESIHEKYEKRSDLYNRAQEILGHLHTVVSDEQ